jgi:hypothetical protein
MNIECQARKDHIRGVVDGTFYDAIKMKIAQYSGQPLEFPRVQTVC